MRATSKCHPAVRSQRPGHRHWYGTFAIGGRELGLRQETLGVTVKELRGAIGLSLENGVEHVRTNRR